MMEGSGMDGRRVKLREVKEQERFAKEQRRERELWGGNRGRTEGSGRRKSDK